MGFGLIQQAPWSNDEICEQKVWSAPSDFLLCFIVVLGLPQHVISELGAKLHRPEEIHTSPRPTVVVILGLW